MEKNDKSFTFKVGFEEFKILHASLNYFVFFSPYALNRLGREDCLVRARAMLYRFNDWEEELKKYEECS